MFEVLAAVFALMIAALVGQLIRVECDYYLPFHPDDKSDHKHHFLI